MKKVMLFTVLCFFIVLSTAQDPIYDHQNKSYTANFASVTVDSAQVTVTPFFSPDWSIEAETWFIDNSTSTLDVGNPSFESWSGCANSTGTIGCTAEYLRENEQFPIFQSLLNAVHRGVKVRILTNNYRTNTSTGMLTPLDFLTAAGAEVRYFTTVTFLHEKYMQADGSRSIVCSVNWDYTSFMENREAGVIIEGPGSTKINAFLASVFELDFNLAEPWWIQHYSSSDMKIINDKSMVPVVIPPPRSYTGAYVTEYQSYNIVADEIVITTAPDDAWQTIFGAVNTTKYSFGLYIYQVTQNLYCEQIKNVWDILDSKDTFTLLVSNTIYDQSDSEAAFECYKELYEYGVPVRMTMADTYRYSHQKFWVINNEEVWISTGNWGSSDMPDGSDVFPPYWNDKEDRVNSDWRLTNRDYTIKFLNSDIVAAFQKVMGEDYTRGYWYSP